MVINKEVPARLVEKYKQQKVVLKQKLKDLKDQGYLIVSADECLFTRSCLRLTEYTNKGCNFHTTDKKITEPVVCLLYSITAEHGTMWW